jgi:2-oxoglutarate ferredoxin oxidoreductase subunit alpha
MKANTLKKTRFLNLFLDRKNGSIIVMQTEDEIAAINAANGAVLTGTRAATSTSGPGFFLNG